MPQPQWRVGTGQTVTASSISSRVAIEPRADCIRVTNTGPNIGHFRVESGLPVASTSDVAVMPGQEVIEAKTVGADSVAFMSPQGTTFHIQTGDMRPAAL